MGLSRREMLALGAVAAPASLLLAQPPTAGPPAGSPAKSPAGRDPLLAACLLVGGKKQIGKCQWAMSRLTTDDAKAFAKAEIDEHEAIKAKLKEFGFVPPGPASGTAAARPASEVVPAGGLPRVEMVTVGAVVLPAAASELIHIDNEVADQCLKNFQEAMSKKSGMKLDKAFVGDQLHAHMGLKDKAEVFARHASAAMKPVLDEGLTIINRHIDTLETLMAKLDGMPDARDPARKG